MKITVYNKENINSDKHIMVDDEDLPLESDWEVSTATIEWLNSWKYKGFDNWRLPTIEELEELFNNRGTIGGFNQDCYWSSSEIRKSKKDDEPRVWRLIFRDGCKSDTHKTAYWGTIRLVRNI